MVNEYITGKVTKGSSIHFDAEALQKQDLSAFEVLERHKTHRRYKG